MTLNKKAYMFSLEYGYSDVKIKFIDNNVIATMDKMVGCYNIQDEMNDVYEASFNEGDYNLPRYIFISENIDCLRNELDKLVNPQNYK